MFDFSGKFGEPEGPGLLRKTTPLDPVKDPRFDPGSPGPGDSSVALEEWAAFDEDAVLVEQGALNSLTCALLDIGTYRVTSSISGIGRPFVTPMSTATSEPEVSTTSAQWFTDTSNVDEFTIKFDPVTGKLFANDYGHSEEVGGPDRIVFGLPTDLTPSYWYLPPEFPQMTAYKGKTFLVDLTYRLLMIQVRAADNDPLDTTIFVDMDNFTVHPDDMVAINGATLQSVVVGFSDDHLVVYAPGGHQLWSRDGDGLPDTLIATYSGAGGAGSIGHQHPQIVDNNGHFWFRNSAAPAEWERYPNTGAAPSRHALGGGYALSDDLMVFNPGENSIYFVDTSYDHLWKISCDSPYTVTQITGSAYPNLSSGNEATTIDLCSSMLFTHDLSKLLFIRGANDFPYFYVVDPADGSIDSALPLLDELVGDNYRHDDIAHWGNFIATRGASTTLGYLQIINYVIGSGGTNLAFTPPLFGARRESLTEFIVEFWNPESLPQKVKMNCGFQIHIARDPT